MSVLLGIWSQNSNTVIYGKCCSYLFISIFIYLYYFIILTGLHLTRRIHKIQHLAELCSQVQVWHMPLPSIFCGRNFFGHTRHLRALERRTTGGEGGKWFAEPKTSSRNYLNYPTYLISSSPENMLKGFKYLESLFFTV